MTCGLPIALAIGAGAELRQPLGIAVVGGLVVSLTLTLFTIPVSYLYVDRFSDWLQRFSRSGKVREPRTGAAHPQPVRVSRNRGRR